MDSNQTDFPFITVQLPVFNEKYVIERLINNIVLLDYPKEKIQFQILDDSTDDTLQLSYEMCDKYKSLGFDISVIHREDRTGYKAGALKNGLLHAKGEFIAIFDADFIPQTDFLKDTLPYFKNEKNGVVQVRWSHLNQNENLLTKLQSMQLNVHFTIEQGGRNQNNYFLQFNGTAGIWRKSTIEDAGGWQADTLTEDLDLSYRAQLKGWKIKFLDHVVSPAELPMEIGGLKSQQFRWMKGGAETAKKLLPDIWDASISFTKKIQASIHLLSSSVYLIVFLLGIVSVPLVLGLIEIKLEFSIFTLFAASLPIIFIIYYFANVIIAWPKESIIKRAFKFIFLFPIFLSLSMGLSFHNSWAVIQGWIGRKSSFVRTPKRGDNVTNNVYKMNPIPLPTIIEGFLVFYYGIGFVMGIYFESYSFLAFHIMSIFGYGYIFIQSLISLKK